MSTATLPFRPLERQALAYLLPRGRCDGNGGDRTTRALADLFEVERRTVHKWRRADRVPLDTADRLAIELGRHLSELWDDEEIEFAFVWAAIDVSYMRRRLREAREEAASLRGIV